MNDLTTRREEEKDRRRAEIRAAAIAVWRDHGWDGVTMDQVARRARLSRALVYVYYRDREDLLDAIAEHGTRVLRERFAAAAARADRGLEKLQAIGLAYVSFAHEEPQLFEACSRFHVKTPTGEPGDRERACLQAHAAVNGVIIEALATGMADGSVRRDVGDPVMVCLSLWAFTHGLIQLGATRGRDLDVQGIDVAALFRQSFDMLRHALATPAGLASGTGSRG
jgi:TetR/AcrR family transcriptional regulator